MDPPPTTTNPSMDLSVKPVGFKLLHSALTYLEHISCNKEIDIEYNPNDSNGILIFSAINVAKTAFSKITFPAELFNPISDKTAFHVKISVGPLAGIVRKSKKIKTLSMSLLFEGVQCFFVLHITKERGPCETHKLFYQDPLETLECNVNLENYSVIHASPETFITTLEQMYESPKVELTATHSTVIIKSLSKNKSTDAKYMETVVSMDTNVCKEYDFRSRLPDVTFNFVTREFKALLGFCKERGLLNFMLFFTDDSTQSFLVLHCDEPSAYKLELVLGIDRPATPGEPEQSLSPGTQMPVPLESQQAPMLSQAIGPSTGEVVESLMTLQRSRGLQPPQKQQRRILESDEEDN